jgi:hypothetical protein
MNEERCCILIMYVVSLPYFPTVSCLQVLHTHRLYLENLCRFKHLSDFKSGSSLIFLVVYTLHHIANVLHNTCTAIHHVQQQHNDVPMDENE